MNGTRSIDDDARRSLAFGSAALVVVLVVPFFRFALHHLITLVHELGHALAGWLFGYPSVPAFDFVYGGGVTAYQERQPALVLLVAAAFAFSIWRFRHRRRAIVAVAIGAAGWGLLAATPLHEAVITFMGHGSELVFAGIFLYRALSGSAIRVQLERPLYAMLGLFIVVEDMRFVWGLLHDPFAREAYENAKGGGHWMDFSQLADRHLHIDLATVAGLFSLAVLAVPLAAWSFHRWHDRVAGAWNRLWLGEIADAR